MFRIVVAVAGLVLVVPQAPSLQDVLSRAGDYVTALRRDCPLIVAEETSTQVLRVLGSTDRGAFRDNDRVPLGATGEHKVRKMRSEFVMMVDGLAWPAFRDVFEVDGKTLRPQKDRLQVLFALPASDDSASAAMKAIFDEALRHQLGTMNRGVNSPVFGLLPLLPAHQPRFAFTKKGEKKVEGASVWVVSYMETQPPMLARNADGVFQPSRGELWIDPAAGRVVRAVVVFDSLDAYPDMKLHPERYERFPRSTIEVTFALQPALNAWLPSKVSELHDNRAEIINWTATYSNYRRIAPPGS